MEIKTCEEYVLNELEQALKTISELEDMVAKLNREINIGIQEYNDCSHDYDLLEDKYVELVNVLRKIATKTNCGSGIMFHSIWQSDNDGYFDVINPYLLEDVDSIDEYDEGESENE